MAPLEQAQPEKPTITARLNLIFGSSRAAIKHH